MMNKGTKPGRRLVNGCILLFLSIAGAVQPAQAKAAQHDSGYVYLVREINLAELGLDGPAGLAYARKADLLLSLSGQAGQPGDVITMLNRIEQLQGQSELTAAPAHPLNMAFNQRFNSLFLIDSAGQELQQANADKNGKLPAVAVITKRHNLNGLGIQQAQGMSFDTQDGRLFILDPAGPRVSIITPDSAGGYDFANAKRESRVTSVDIKGIGKAHLRGLAVNTRSGNLFTLDPGSAILYEISPGGDLLESRDLSSFGLEDPRNLVFAPSGDMTDEPGIENLYMADPARNFIIEISITPVSTELLPAMAAADSISLVKTVQTSLWNPTSPDPSGIEYLPSRNSLLVVDGEVDEMPLFQGANVFESSFDGSLRSTCVTSAFSNEPTGVAVNPANGHIFTSDDNKKMIFEINQGGDKIYCTADDTVTSFDTLAYNMSDPEGLAFGGGRLIVADGLNMQVYVISPGANGRFDGGPPTGDDQATSFDTGIMGLRDPEGIGFHPLNGTVIISSRDDKTLVESSLTGSVRRTFDITFLHTISPAGVAVAPGSLNSQAVNVYLAVRGVDNNDNEGENDGKYYELDLGDRVSAPNNTRMLLPIISSHTSIAGSSE